MNTLWLSSLATVLVKAMGQQLDFQGVTQPSLNLESFNDAEFGILGNFDSITPYSYLGISNFTNQNGLRNQLYYTEGSNEQFITLGQIHGTVSRIFPFSNDSFLLVGDFESIGTRSASNPSIYNVTTNEFIHLGNITDINAVLLNDDESVVYIGGDFSFNNSYSAAIYNLTSGKLQSTLFDGFGDDSVVNSIVKIGSNIVFGGQFNTLGLPELISQSFNETNSTIETDQIVSLRHANLSSSDGSSNPEVLICPAGEEWTVSGSSATLNIQLPFTVIPSKLRIYNSANVNYEISMFRLITSPTNGIMNLTYVDPQTGELSFCDAWCPLLSSSELVSAYDDSDSIDRVAEYGDSTISWSQSYQEFAFVNSLDVDLLNFQALESYGDAIALAGFEIYQSIFPTYAYDVLNDPSCDSTVRYSQAELTGSWDVVGSYMETTVQISDEIPDVGVTFLPNITYAGDYSILMYTPGCAQDNTCDTRGIVNVTVVDIALDEVLESHLIYQTNQEEKYDSIFYGHLDNAVRVDMVLYSAVAGSSTTEVTVVADRITTNIFSADTLQSTNGSIPINGIFEYSPSNFTNFNAANLSETILVGNTTLNSLGSNISSDASIQLALLDDTLYVAGDFQSDYGDNLFRVDIDSDEDLTPSSFDGGLNGPVLSLTTADNYLVLLGEFDSMNNQTDVSILSSQNDSLSGSAFFNGEWYSFGSGVGTSFAYLSLFGEDYWLFENETWDLGEESWYINTNLLSFNSTAASSSSNVTLFTGSLATSQNNGNMGVLMNSDGNVMNVTNDTLTHSSFVTGLFINESLAAYGGQFVTSNDISNLILATQGSTDGLDINWEDNSTVTSLFHYQDRLFIGTQGSGSVADNDFDGLLIYNLNNDTFESAGSLSNSAGTVVVNGLGIFNNTYLVVGGSFDSADGTDCSGFCFYNMNETSWTQLISDLSGTVNHFRFVNNTLVACGDLDFNGETLHLFTYDFNLTTQEQPVHFSEVESSVNTFILVDDSLSGRIIVASDSFISAFDGSSWVNITGDLDGTINDIALLELSETNSANDGSYFNSSQILMASGNFTIGEYGYANMALFNSTSWIPYVVVTAGQSTATINSIYLNKDISNLFISGTLTNSTRPETTSSAVPSPTSSTSSERNSSGKMDRGFIALVGLACAVGTVGLLGSIGAIFLFRKREQEYMPIEPRVNETEMLETVPPENLFKHV